MEIPKWKIKMLQEINEKAKSIETFEDCFKDEQITQAVKKRAEMLSKEEPFIIILRTFLKRNGWFHGPISELNKRLKPIADELNLSFFYHDNPYWLGRKLEFYKTELKAMGISFTKYRYYNYIYFTNKVYIKI